MITVLLILLFITCKNIDYSYPEVKQGFIDLSDWDFENDGPVELKGDWKYVWMEHSDEFISKEYNDSEWGYYNVPYNWRSNKDSAYGFIWLRLTVKINPDDRLFLYQSTCFNSYSMYINGDAYINVGIPGDSRENSESKILPVIKNLPDMDENIFVIAWKISNFDDINGGPGTVPIIGLYSDLFVKLWLPDIINTFILGILL